MGLILRANDQLRELPLADLTIEEIAGRIDADTATSQLSRASTVAQHSSTILAMVR
jgi:hypothetical protein